MYFGFVNKLLIIEETEVWLGIVYVQQQKFLNILYNIIIFQIKPFPDYLNKEISESWYTFQFGFNMKAIYISEFKVELIII